MDACYLQNSQTHWDYVSKGYQAWVGPTGQGSPESFKNNLPTVVVTKNLADIASIPSETPDWALDNIVRQLREWEVHYVLRLDGSHFNQPVSESVRR